MDSVGEVLDVAEMMGIVQRGGSWYTVGEERFQGRTKTIEYLRENTNVVEDLKEKNLWESMSNLLSRLNQKVSCQN